MVRKIKSRPSFKDILKDNIRGISPSANYSNLDFEMKNSV